ncbi:MAG: DUF1549 and DUF1553 domain-containing protein [Planctomycetia bacterium]|nr:DUF1549 and DUF1553 domain-containing protein [Planctomycetia bacterium]
MRFRPLALFTLTAVLVVLGGSYTVTDAQEKRKKGKKAPVDPPPIVIPNDPNTPPLKAPTSTLPTPKTKDASALAKLIDQQIAKKLAEAKITPSAICTDEEFLRRVYLDITGVIPPAEKVRAFLDDKTPDKRAKLIDELLADPNYGRRMADIWTAKLYPRDSNTRFVNKEPFYKWLEEQFNKNVMWDQFVTSLVTATGTMVENPATVYFVANRAVDKLTDTTSQHFLGIQLQCAQCHNHPFTDWKQNEYWGMAAFYSKVQTGNPKNPKKADNSQVGVTEGNVKTRQKDFFPESAKNIAPKFLGGDSPKFNANEAYRPVLAKWMTSPENPFFARALVNRTWAHLFGRGFVDPVDDMKPENEPSHPELLNALGQHISTTGGFDLKYLIKAICLTETYQRTSKPNASNKSDKKLFSHMAMKVLSPEQLYDSLAQVTGAGRGVNVRPKGPAAKGGRVGGREQFVTFFLAGADSTSPIDYEAGIPQALRLMNSPIANNPAAVRAITGVASKPEECIERIYIVALSRRPTAEEIKNLTAYVKRVGENTAYSDILWAVLNSSEFTLVR